MSFVDVFPVEPVIPTTRAELRSRTAPAIAARAAKASSGTSVAAAPGARASSRNARAVADRDEEVARLDAPRVDLHAGHALLAGELPGRERADLLDVERDHARSASRATSRSSNGSFSAPIS